MTDKRLLGGYLRTISNALSQDLQQQAEQLGLTSSQGMFLHHIWKRRQEGLETYARDLEEFFYIKHSTVSGILQRMEAAGFIALRAKEDDKRCKAIELFRMIFCKKTDSILKKSLFFYNIFRITLLRLLLFYQAYLEA